MVQTEVEYAEKASKKEADFIPLLGSRKYYLHLFNNDDYPPEDPYLSDFWASVCVLF